MSEIKLRFGKRFILYWTDQHESFMITFRECMEEKKTHQHPTLIITMNYTSFMVLVDAGHFRLVSAAQSTEYVSTWKVCKLLELPVEIKKHDIPTNAAFHRGRFTVSSSYGARIICTSLRTLHSGWIYGSVVEPKSYVFQFAHFIQAEYMSMSQSSWCWVQRFESSLLFWNRFELGFFFLDSSYKACAQL